MMLLKTVRVKNEKNVLVQIPGFVIEAWGIKKHDALEMTIGEDNIIRIAPKAPSDGGQFDYSSAKLVK